MTATKKLSKKALAAILDHPQSHPNDGDVATLRMPARMLRDAVRVTDIFRSRDLGRPLLCGVHIVRPETDGEVVFVATDSYRLVELTVRCGNHQAMTAASREARDAWEAALRERKPNLGAKPSKVWETVDDWEWGNWPVGWGATIQVDQKLLAERLASSARTLTNPYGAATLTVGAPGRALLVGDDLRWNGAGALVQGESDMDMPPAFATRANGAYPDWRKLIEGGTAASESDLLHPDADPVAADAPIAGFNVAYLADVARAAKIVDAVGDPRVWFPYAGQVHMGRIDAGDMGSPYTLRALLMGIRFPKPETNGAKS